jgi:hypothetical protein
MLLCFSTNGSVYNLETIDAYADWLEVHSHTADDDDCQVYYVIRLSSHTCQDRIVR